MWQAMDVGDGGAGRETAEWVNVLLATFWSILQPIVSRYFWKSRWQPVMTRQYYTICYLQGGQKWCGAIGSRTFKVCEVLASWWYFIKFSCSPQNWFYFNVPPVTCHCVACSWIKIFAGNTMWGVFVSKALTSETRRQGWERFVKNYLCSSG